jgi:RHS repeat-associated protein
MNHLYPVLLSCILSADPAGPPASFEQEMAGLIEQNLKHLREGTTKEKLSAIHDLMRLPVKPSDVTPLLEKLLEDDETRLSAALAMAFFDPNQLATSKLRLRCGLDEVDSAQRLRALSYLEVIGPDAKEFLPDLRKLVEDSEEPVDIRGQALAAIAEIGRGSLEVDSLMLDCLLSEEEQIAHSYLGADFVVEVDSPQPSLTYTLIGIAGGNDPVTGDIYRGLDLFGRVKDLIWTGSGGSSSSSSSGAANVVERIQHGYDNVGNRLWRKELADSSASHDELYFYDGIYRLKDMQRGTLNSTETAIVPMNFSQCWSLDATGNWQSFREDDAGAGVWNLIQSRAANNVNEITGLSTQVGATWVTPKYDATGNMTTMPQPGSPATSYAATYDAWNQLMGLSSGGSQVAGYQYDGLKRRTIKLTYSGGVLSQTRDQYYSSRWQVLEERVNGASSADRQFIWGQHEKDDLILRDRDATGSGTLNERFYALQDPNWNVTALADITGTVQERYSYSAYGMLTVLTPAFGIRTATLYNWETQFAGYRWDSESGLYQVRNRVYAASLGVWLQRDPLGLAAGISLYQYVDSNPLTLIDPLGSLVWLVAGLFFTKTGWAILGTLGTGIVVIAVTAEETEETAKACTELAKGLDVQPPREPPKDIKPPPKDDTPDMCDFNYQWCLWGLACRKTAKDYEHWWTYVPKLDWITEANCEYCLKVCKDKKFWPFEDCPIGGEKGPRWQEHALSYIWPPRKANGAFDCVLVPPAVE